MYTTLQHVVTIVKIIFICSFFFQLLLFKNSFPTNLIYINIVQYFLLLLGTKMSASDRDQLRKGGDSKANLVKFLEGVERVITENQ